MQHSKDFDVCALYRLESNWVQRLGSGPHGSLSRPSDGTLPKYHRQTKLCFPFKAPQLGVLANSKAWPTF